MRKCEQVDCSQIFCFNKKENHLLAHLTRFLLRKRESVLNNKIIPFFANAQVVFLSLAFMAMFASRGAYLLDNLKVIYIFIIPVLLFLLLTIL